ncbi:glutamine--fructose-6-phosphate transaminase (isomerizing) [Patescibacteria group bacterium]|nr:glutamine--fructose-6-phosphate transaminase (isomerizing) [Patescibacteria group bacterium]MBU1916408.1 glutamine--fructose-6-phosphate transaminase (isomerizing) [Patescibacteria group bacterium]
MCGIVGYIGSRHASGVLIEGLRRLEYRGYDSAGLATVDSKEIQLVKVAGKIANLSSVVQVNPISGTVGIAHTRWATHGPPSDINAHPHLDCQGTIAVVHNGIIENFDKLRRKIIESGHQLRSETDTEVIAHLLEEQIQNKTFEEALFSVLVQLEGTFGLAMICTNEPRKIFAARRGSPLVLGLGKNRDEFFVASDPAAIISYTQDIMYLDDNEVAVLSDSGVETFSLDRNRTDKKIESIEITVGEMERGGYSHFMLKEMHEQPEVVTNAIRGRLDFTEGLAVLGGLSDVVDQLRDLKRLTIVGCGSACLAGTIGSYMLEEYAGLPVNVQLASEFRYRKPILDPKREAIIVVSQSGETADTLGALREAKQKGVLTIGVVNAVGSSIARETDAGVFVHAGPEIAVASTKAFVAQVTVFALLTMFLGRMRGMSRSVGVKIAEELRVLPHKIDRILRQEEWIRLLARKYAHSPNMVFIGRKYNAAVAFEGALKMKEISYLHAEGFAAGELKHGPMALLDPSLPVVALMTRDSVFEKVRSNVEEVRARRAPVIAVVSEGDEEILSLTDDIMFVPRTLEMLSPILNVIPLQMLAFYTALARGHDPDQPRNLAKSVTVE